MADLPNQQVDANTVVQLVDAIIDYAVYMLDLDGCIKTWNSGAERIEGYSADEILGRPFSCFFTKEDAAAGVPGAALRTARDTGRFVGEGWRVRKDGSRFWASVVIHAIREDDIVVAFAKVARDMTESREAQLELERSRERLIQSQKMEAVGELTGGLAHNFNNLLMGIAGSLDVMERRIAQGRADELARYIDMARDGTQRAATLTQRLLAFSRRQTLVAAPVDPNALTVSVLELVRSSLDPAIDIETALARDVWPVWCDANHLESAVLNLCLNGRDAMPSGGRLTISTENVRLEADAAEREGILPGAYVMVSVSDTGTGMAPGIVAKAFDPFFTTKPLGQGTGLGLSMVYGFASQSGGQARIASAEGEGTTVRLYLPRHLGRPSGVTGGAKSRFASGLRSAMGEHVLVVEDEPAVRLLVCETLEDLGYRVSQAGDAVGGAKILDEDRRIDLLITDVRLPCGMNGRQLADAARRDRPGLRVLFITGFADSATLRESSLEPGMHILAKPFAIDRLEARVRSILAH